LLSQRLNENHMTFATPPPHYPAPMVQLDSVGSVLLEAAGELLAAEGPAALTVRRIANAAGVSTMNVYSRFGGKDGVVDHLFIEGFRKLASCMSSAALTDDPIADLAACGMGYRQFAIDNPTLYSVMFDRVVPDYVPTIDAQLIAVATLELLASRLERAMKAGVLRHADPLQTAALVWATCHGVVSLESKPVESTTINWAEVYQQALSMVVQGLS
jgi:AcrR family transcriptional regulator